ncbi:hypothetical protein KGA66_24405 [Actinocrinis puniceicyclus]|uniref:Uncharacterized protein n=1 Tax=Actinocrinis puniceicyclus TaxID=977794 RepID=A0A8J7WU61_9ACTN|nr:hypothetical protein [Actinocrinis puniceicyclus]MBS2966209.1 hypothetical protein [Actinocrinis puniceicyclus]
MVDKGQLWREFGLHKFEIVECEVVEHRGHFGVDVDVLTPHGKKPAFIDFVLLAEPGTAVTPRDFPPVGTVLRAVTLDFMPWGELRLSARSSSIQRQELIDLEAAEAAEKDTSTE